MIVLTLIAPPGGGKGTQAKKISAAYDLPILEFSKRLDADKHTDKRLGDAFDEAKRQGTLLGDDVVMEKLQQWLQEPQYSKGVIIDGFPRTVNQAEALDRMLAEMNESVSMAIDFHFDKSDEELLFDRQRGRKQQMIDAGEKPREDDGNEETMRRRMSIYWKDTAPVSDYYRDNHEDVLLQIDGTDTIENNFAQISDGLGDRGILPRHNIERQLDNKCCGQCKPGQS